MTNEELSIAQELMQKLKSANKKLEEFWDLKNGHNCHPEKEFSISKIGHGWVSFPPELKPKILSVLNDFLINESVKAEKEFNNFKSN